MDTELLDELYQSLILDHSRKPRNFGTLSCACHSHGKNPSCGDELELYIIEKEGKVADVKFTGQGCALSMSSASLMTQAVKGQDIIYVKNLFKEFIEFILDEDKSLNEEYEPLHIFHNVRNFPLRVKCVLLPWRTLEHVINHQSQSATSE